MYVMAVEHSAEAVTDTVIGRKLCQRVGLLGRWEAVTGPTHTIAIRSDDPPWQQLTATENVWKGVEITRLLQSTTTFRVSGVTVVR